MPHKRIKVLMVHNGEIKNNKQTEKIMHEFPEPHIVSTERQLIMDKMDSTSEYHLYVHNSSKIEAYKSVNNAYKYPLSIGYHVA